MKNIFVSLICQYNLPIMKELLYLKDEQLKDLIEKLFVSYRETFSDSKKILDRYSIGLAHHKVIFYQRHRYPLKQDSIYPP